MRGSYFRGWVETLEARLDEGEPVLARGRAFEPLRMKGLDLGGAVSGPGCALLVTERRALWIGRSGDDWVRALPFALVRTYTEITQSHRYALALEHDDIEILQLGPAHRFAWLTWGNVEALRPATSSMLAFSRRDTEASRAMRARLELFRVPAHPSRSLPTLDRASRRVRLVSVWHS